jgi:hypothetical protein
VSVSDLFWFGDPTPAAALAESAFLWLSIDGTPQALSDLANLGFVFGTHPLNPSIPVLLIDNIVWGPDPLTRFLFDRIDLLGPARNPTSISYAPRRCDPLPPWRASGSRRSWRSG